MDIVYINTLNNYSGSPKVLSIIIRELINRGYPTTLLTSSGPGFLTGISGIRYISNGYRWTGSKILTSMFWIWSQIRMFFCVLWMPRKNTCYYINTVTPIGAVWACWLTRKYMIYHVHEDMQNRKSFFYIYRNTYRICNKKSIFVSYYLQNKALNCRGGIVAYNALDCDFVTKAKSCDVNDDRNDILFVGALRLAKGVYEFVELSRRLPQYHFTMVVSALADEVAKFIQETRPASNLTIYPVQTNLHPFYSKAKVVLQLSHPDKWIETFGLTILEAMTYGIPVIAPDAGGPKELIEHNISGFLVNPTNIEEITGYLNVLMTNTKLYSEMSQAARERSYLFDIKNMVDQIEKYIKQ